MRAKRFVYVTAVSVLVFGGWAFAWGPHSDIAIAAAKVLDKDDPILAYIKNDLNLLGSMAWMGDNASGNGVVKIWNAKLYARDVAFFPGWNEFGRGHGEPGETGYEPVFRRILQAMRTETPANAIGWIGQLTHITEDTGCPPHATGCCDERHSCENWIDASKIDIAGYKPQLLGKTEEEALKGYLARIKKLHEYTLKQAEKALPLAAEKKKECAAVVMESAIESARVVADLLHTLGSLQSRMEPVKGTGGLSGTVKTKPGPDAVVAKIILLGTNYSTLADADGKYSFRNLPPGEYNLAVMKPSSLPKTAKATVKADKETALDIELAPSDPPGSLLRNGDFSVTWMCKGAPDGWCKVGNVKPPTMQWFSEPFEVKPGQTFRLTADWQEGVEGEAAIMCENELQKPLTAGTKSGTFTIPAEVKGFRGLAWVSIRTTKPLTDTLKSIAATMEPTPSEK